MANDDLQRLAAQHEQEAQEEQEATKEAWTDDVYGEFLQAIRPGETIKTPAIDNFAKITIECFHFLQSQLIEAANAGRLAELEAKAEEPIANYGNTIFGAALFYLESLHKEAEKQIKEYIDAGGTAKEALEELRQAEVLTASYYFALTEDFESERVPGESDVSRPGDLTDDQKSDLADLYNEFLEFYDSREEKGQILNVFFDFIRSQTPEKAEIIIKKVVPASLVPFSLDEFNRDVWNGLLKMDKSGQYTLGEGKDGELVPYTIIVPDTNDNPNLKVTVPLTPFDRRVYGFIQALDKAGNKYISVAQICKLIWPNREPGSQPSQGQMQRVIDSLEKMRNIQFVSTKTGYRYTDETKTRKEPVDLSFKGPILAFRTITATINGKRTHEAIFLLKGSDDELLPLIALADKQRRTTQIEAKLLAPPKEASVTNDLLAIQDYLIYRIALMKRNPEFTRKIDLATIYKTCNITGKQKSRAPAKITKCLDELVFNGYILGYLPYSKAKDEQELYENSKDKDAATAYKNALKEWKTIFQKLDQEKRASEVKISDGIRIIFKKKKD